MIAPEEFEALLTPEVQRAIAGARGRNPADVALDRRVPCARLVATQVKYLQRAERKLPSYAAAQCILPPRAFEQASSEACAARKRIGGGTALDLTCGLGVDALALSRRFDRVVALERDGVLAAAARENFRRLGARNIEVVNTSAEEFLQREGLRFDWIYADPDRRSAEGRKLVRLEDCSPSIPALLPLVRRASARLCLKNSPLFDVDEAFRLFPDARVEVLSLDGECKEVVIYADGQGPLLTATAIAAADSGAADSGAADSGAADAALGQRCGGTFSVRPGTPPPRQPEGFDPGRYRWLVVPDAALQKARIVRHHLAGRADIWSDNGFGLSAGRPEGVIGRVFAIGEILPYDPHRLKRSLRGLGAEVFKRDFPFSAEETMRRLGLHAGGDVRLAFTKIDGRFWMIRLK